MSATTTDLKVRALHSDFAIEIDERIDEIMDDPDAIERIRELWQTSPLIIFPRQCLEEADQVRFTGMFGKCETANRKDIQSPYHEEIIYFSTLRYADGRFVGGFAGGDDVDWHSDQTFIGRPATGAILYGVEVPKGGGDIYWADQYAAWDSLPADVKALIEGRTGTYHYAKRFAILKAPELKNTEQGKKMAALPPVQHPVVLTHPVTGRKALYADPTTLVSIDGLSEEENARVLPILFKAGGNPAFVYRHKVRNGDLMFWDNGCTMHRRDEMSVDQPRLMKRTTFRLTPDAHCVPHG